MTMISTSVALCYAASQLHITGHFRRAFCQSAAVCTPQPVLSHVLLRRRCVDSAAVSVTCSATASLCGRHSSYDACVLPQYGFVDAADVSMTCSQFFNTDGCEESLLILMVFSSYAA